MNGSTSTATATLLILDIYPRLHEACNSDGKWMIVKIPDNYYPEFCSNYFGIYITYQATKSIIATCNSF